MSRPARVGARAGAAGAGGVRREIRLTIVSAVFALAVALPACVGIVREMVGTGGSAGDSVAAAIAAVALGAVAYGVVMHHLARIGYLTRWSGPDAPAVAPIARAEPLLTVLVPAYREEPAVVRKAMLSAALQEGGPRRVVLLIDDSPAPETGADREALLAMRRLAGEVAHLLADLRRPAAAAAAAFERRNGSADLAAECRALAGVYRRAADWFEAQAQPYRGGGHVDRFFADAVLDELGRRMNARAAAWELRAGDPAVRRTDVEQGYREALAAGGAEVTSFERKRYANLSHAPNKAMNLNGYLSLIAGGGCFREERHPDGILLRPCAASEASVRVPVTPYVLMLDADTVLRPDYAARMLAVLRRPENAGVAVAQAPYAAFPGAPGALERVAGATTDVQCLLHHGMARFGATFWVGANAVVRTAALRDMATTTEERGWTVPRILHDRTVIEDTETTLELLRRGWTLHSHPEHLAFSATPPDFGALLVQRLRWANGGLVLLPRLARALAAGRGRATGLAGAALRLHYLLSLGPMSLALLALPFCSFAGPGARALPLLAASYLAMYLRDLRRCGYGWMDVARVYALNLLLIPVNLAGLLLSLRQAITGRRPRFVRTPKTAERVPVPGVAVVAEAAMLSFWLLFAVHLAVDGRAWQAALVLAHVGLLAYAITRFVGWRAAAGDLLADLWPDLERPRRAPAPAAWRAVRAPAPPAT